MPYIGGVTSAYTHPVEEIDPINLDTLDDVNEYGIPLRGSNSTQADDNISRVVNGWNGTVPVAATGKGQAILNTAYQYLGFRESRGQQAIFTGEKYKSSAWCAFFVTYVMKQAFGNSLPQGFGSASVQTLMNWGISKGRFLNTANMSSSARASAIKSQVKPGDIIIFKRNGRSHTGIVTSIGANGQISTIEGNTWGNGDKDPRVMEKSYSPNEDTLSGFIKMS